MRDLAFSKLDSLTELMQTAVPGSAELLSGKANLLQQVIKRLLTLKGSYAENREYGTEFPRYAYGRYATDVSKFPVALSAIINDLVSQIKNSQRDKDINNDERLVKIDIVSAEYDSTLGGWYVILDMYTADYVGTLIRVL